jgi:hypothetical protein
MDQRRRSMMPPPQSLMIGKASLAQVSSGILVSIGQENEEKRL